MKLDVYECEKIRARVARGESRQAIANEYGVSRNCICNALRRTRKHNVLWPGADSLPFERDTIAQAVVAELGPLTLEQVAFIMGVTRERIRQIEEVAIRKLSRGFEDPRRAA